MVINPIVGVYIPIIRIPTKGGMTIPNIATFDHGTYETEVLEGLVMGISSRPLPYCLPPTRNLADW